MTRLSFAASLALSVACSSEPAPVQRQGFESGTLALCDPSTSEIGLTTQKGGLLTIEVIDHCGRSLGVCEAPDVYAPGARTSIRTAGTDVLVEGCSIDATAGVSLRAWFHPPDTVEASEAYEVALRGDCLATPSCSDSGVTAADGGV